MKAKLAQQSGFPPQLMHSVHILRMGAEMLAEFLRQHNNLCLAPSHLPMRIDDDENIRRLLRRRCLDTPPPPALHDIVNDLIECIEDNGLLDIPPSWAADIAKQPLADAVTYLQSIAPLGVGGQTQQEIFLLQLQDYPNTPARQAAETLIRHHLPALMCKRWDKLPKRKISIAMPLLEKLSAAPGAAYSPSAAQQIPDIVYVKQRGLWRATAGNGLAINATLRKNADASRSEKAQAQAIIAACRSRRHWVLKTAQLAADHQSAYFANGAAALRPFSLREAASALQTSAAFLSHIVHDKTAVFSGGSFPLKLLFARRSVVHSGAAVQALITTMLKEENPHRPLSDENLCRLLRKNGVLISRRTVNKQRQQAGFPAACLRKKFPHDKKEISHAN